MRITQGPPTAQTVFTAFIRHALVVFVLIYPLVFNPLGFQMFAHAKAFILFSACFMLAFSYAVVSVDRMKLEAPNDMFFKLAPLFLAALGISTLTSINPQLSLYGAFGSYGGFLTWTAYIVLAIAGYLYAHDAVERHMVRALAAAVLVASVYALVQQLGYDIIPWTRLAGAADRPSGIASTLGSAAALGLFLAFSLPVLVAGVRCEPRVETRLYLRFAAAAGLLALFLTQSKSAWLGLIAAVLFFGVAVLARLDKRALFVAAALFACALLAGIGVMFTVPAAKEKAVSVTRTLTASPGGRVLLWSSTVRMTGERPLTGWGPDAFAPALSASIERRLTAPESAGLRAEHRRALFDEYLTANSARNEPLELAATAGLPAVTILCAMLILFIVRVVRYGRHLAVGIAAGVVAYCCALLTQSGGISVAPVVFLFMGSALRGSKREGEAALAERQVATEPVSRQALPALVMLMFVPLIVFCLPVLADMNYRQAMAAVDGGDVEGVVKRLDRAQLYHSWGQGYEIRTVKTLLALHERTGDTTVFEPAEDALKGALGRGAITGDTALVRARFYFQKARYCYDDASLPEAAAAYRELLLVYPEYGEGHMHLGTVLFEQDRLEQAIAEWKTAERLMPGSSSVAYNLAVAYEEQGNKAEAQRYYREVVQSIPGHAQ